jgi:carbon monoxide dehydrogenase subunit G
MPRNPERTAAATVVVSAPPEAVWELVSDPERFGEWAELTEEVIRADKPLRLGSTYEERNVVLGPIKGTSRWTVVQHEAPRRQMHRGEGIALASSLDFFMELEPAERATQLTVGLRYRPGLGALGALIDRIHLRGSVQAAMERSAANVAAIAERELAAAAP